MKVKDLLGIIVLNTSTNIEICSYDEMFLVEDILNVYTSKDSKLHEFDDFEIDSIAVDDNKLIIYLDVEIKDERKIIDWYVYTDIDDSCGFNDEQWGTVEQYEPIFEGETEKDAIERVRKEMERKEDK